MKRIAGVLLMLSLGGCASLQAPACPPGQEHLRTAQLFLGRAVGASAIDESALRRFVDEEITPRFPDGVTVLDGGRQWQGSENRLIREAAKVVSIVLPRRSAADARLKAVRAAYVARFKQETLLVTQSACVSL